MRKAALVMAVMASLLAFLPAAWSAPCAECDALAARVEKEKKGAHACGRKGCGGHVVWAAERTQETPHGQVRVPARVVTTRCADCAEGLEKGSGPCARCLEEHGKKAGKIRDRLPLSGGEEGK